MKKFLNYGLALLAVALASPVFVACDDDDDSDSGKYRLTVNLSYPEGVTRSEISDLQLVIAKDNVGDTIKLAENVSNYATKLKMGSYTVSAKGTLANAENAFIGGSQVIYLDKETELALPMAISYGKLQLSITAILPEGLSAENITNGKLTITDETNKDTTITLGNELSYTGEFERGDYNVAFEAEVNSDQAIKDVVLGYTSVTLLSSQDIQIQLTTKGGTSPLIFKEIFCAGGKAGYTQDTYFEIVNNSDEVQYLDQLVMLYGSAAQKAPNAWQASGVTDIYHQAQGPVVAFPGSGKDYPIQPGQSVVIANDATNHQEADPDGIHSDLSKADWEIYLEYSRMGDTDYEAPNLSPIYYNNAYMRAFALGFFNGAYILAKLPVTPEAYAADSTSYSTTPGTTSATLYMGIASKYVLDAVEAWDRDDAEHYPYFLPKDDAHAVWAPVGFEGKALRRKVAKIENGRVYYKDTNNSSEDFLTDQPQTPGIAPTAVDK